jgi:hypothetical protein
MESKMAARCKSRIDKTLILMGSLVVNLPLVAGDAPSPADISLYASFDEIVQADVGGELRLRTRADHPERKGEFVLRDGFPASAFQISKGTGVSDGALECRDVLDHRGRIFFPAKGNLAYDPKGWSGAISLWISTNPDKQLKTPFCDPIQITHKGADNGAIWLDFPDEKPRSMRMGIFPGLKPGDRPLKESDPGAPIVRLPRVGFQTGEWHHLAASWKNFDTGHANAVAQFYVDGKLIGELANRELAMRWDIENAGIYIAVNFIGLMDEFAVFKRSLSAEEVKYLYQHPRYLNESKRIRK